MRYKVNIKIIKKYLFMRDFVIITIKKRRREEK